MAKPITARSPPAADRGGEALKLHSNSGFGGHNNAPAKKPVGYNTDGTKKIPKEYKF